MSASSTLQGLFIYLIVNRYRYIVLRVIFYYQTSLTLHCDNHSIIWNGERWITNILLKSIPNYKCHKFSNKSIFPHSPYTHLALPSLLSCSAHSYLPMPSLSSCSVHTLILPCPHSHLVQLSLSSCPVHTLLLWSHSHLTLPMLSSFSVITLILPCPYTS